MGLLKCFEWWFVVRVSLMFICSKLGPIVSYCSNFRNVGCGHWLFQVRRTHFHKIHSVPAKFHTSPKIRFRIYWLSNGVPPETVAVLTFWTGYVGRSVIRKTRSCVGRHGHCVRGEAHVKILKPSGFSTYHQA